MSEPMFPAPDSGTAAPAVSPAVESGGNRKALLAVGGVAAAVIVGGAAFLLMSTGGSTPEALPVAPAPAASAPAASPSPSASAAPAVIRPATRTATGRDPFKPLFVVAVAANPAPAPTAAAPVATPVAPVPAATPVGKQVTLTVSKIDLAAQTATIGVDTKSYKVGVGKAFGTYFSMYSVFNASCVGVLYGDQSVPVCLTQPQTVSPS